MNFGTVEFGEPREESIGEDRSGAAIRVKISTGRWTPPEQLQALRDAGVFLPLERWETTDGFRRYWPRMGFESLLQIAPPIGLEIVRQVRDLSSEEASYYQGALKVFRLARGISYLNERGMRVHLTRGFNYSRDLFVRAPSRFTDSERSVLPVPCSISKLNKIGLEAARHSGIRSCNAQTRISYGLLVTAQSNPFSTQSAKEIEYVVRSSLFDAEAFADPPDEETRKIVLQRLADAMNKHAFDSPEEFNKWMFGPKSSLVKQLAKQKKADGGELDRAVVKRVLLHLGWESYLAVGDCLHACMRWVRHSLPDELSQEEKNLYDQMYQKQTFLADLPLAMIVERLALLKPAILQLWHSEINERKIGVLHRMMDYYSQMASGRREADLRGKSRRDKKEEGSEQNSHIPNIEVDNRIEDENTPDAPEGKATSYEVELHPEMAVERFCNDDLHRDLIEHLSEKYGARCKVGCSEWGYELQKLGENKYEITIYCECPEPRSFTVSKVELDKESRKLDPDREKIRPDRKLLDA